MAIDKETLTKLKKISKNVSLEELKETELILTEFTRSYFETTKELLDVVRRFQPKVLEHFGLPSTLTKRVRALNKLFDDEKLTDEQLINETSFSLRDLILIANTISEILENTPDDIANLEEAEEAKGEEAEEAKGKEAEEAETKKVSQGNKKVARQLNNKKKHKR